MDFKTFWIIVLVIAALTAIIFYLISLNNKLCAAPTTSIGSILGNGNVLGDNSKVNNN